MKHIYTLEEIKAMPTIEVGHDADLKYEDKEEGVRVWLSRVGKEDGMPYDNAVIVEKRIDGKWEVVNQYEAK